MRDRRKSTDGNLNRRSEPLPGIGLITESVSVITILRQPGCQDASITTSLSIFHAEPFFSMTTYERVEAFFS